MTTTNKINWLTAFISLWDATEEDDQHATLTSLMKQFCKQHKLPHVSADELIIKIQKLVGTQLEISDVEDLLEQLNTETFIIARHSKQAEYTLDNEKQPHDGRADGGTDVWIEMACTPEVIAELEQDYNKFAKSFKEWAAKNNLSNPEILNTDNSITYKVNI